MNVLSLFDGISCGQLALSRGGIPVDKYYASEIDKNAITVTMKNFPHTIQLGDVNTVNFADYARRIDLLLGGSPCQDLSIANKGREGLDGNRSGLFWKYVKALEVVQPTYFLFENVASMSKVAKDTITEVLGVDPVLIDSALVSAQTRKRLYWTNIPGVCEPEDRGVLLMDILEDLTEEQLQEYTLSANALAYMDRPTSNGRLHWDYGYHADSREDKSKYLTANIYKGVPYNVLIDRYSAARIIGRKINERGVRDDYNPNIKAVQRIEVNRNPQKANTLTTVTKDNIVTNGEIIRHFTEIECERLQTLPDDYTAGISKTQRYKVIGNGWTVDVIAHILSRLSVVKRGGYIGGIQKMA